MLSYKLVYTIGVTYLASPLNFLIGCYPMNATQIAIANRAQVIQPLNIELADKIFGESLVNGLQDFNGKLNIELTDKNVPQSGKGIFKMYVLALEGVETFKVFNGANDKENLFFSPETNLLYRTLHDIDHALHYKQGKGTTSKDNELFLNCLMAKRAFDYAIESGYTLAQACMAFLCVYHDTVGQVYFYFENNDFCENQKALTAQLLADCKGMAYLNNGSITSAHQFIIGLMNECKVL